MGKYWRFNTENTIFKYIYILIWDMFLHFSDFVLLHFPVLGWNNDTRKI